MSKQYDARDWYWRREDGSLFSSARIESVADSDPDFLAWAEDGTPVSQYPRDEAGNESVAELQRVLDAYDLHASLAAYQAKVRYGAEIRGVTVEVGGEPVPVSTRREDRDGLGQTMLAILGGLRADGASFKFADGVSRPATNAEMQVAIATAFGHVQAAFDTETTVLADIAAGTIATKAEVEAAYADPA